MLLFDCDYLSMLTETLADEESLESYRSSLDSEIF